MRLKATKTSMYKLVAKYINLPAMNETDFWKAFRSPDYSLGWNTDGISYQAFLSACMGKPLLSIQMRDIQREIERKVYSVTVQELRERGMIDCTERTKER